MALQVGGWSINSVAEVDAKRDLIITERPTDHGFQGHFSIGHFPAAGFLVTPAGSINLFQFCWLGAVPAVIRRVAIGVGASSTTFTAGVTKIQLIMNRFLTAIGTGAAAATLPSNNNNAVMAQRRRTEQFFDTLVRDVRIATNVAPGAVTAQPDNQPFASYCHSVPAVAGSVVFPFTNVYECRRGSNPLVLGEGDCINVQLTTPATGSCAAAASVDWEEIPNYP